MSTSSRLVVLACVLGATVAQDAADPAAAAAAAAAVAVPAPEAPSATQAIISIVQTCFFCVMGPIVMFYGPVVIRVVIVIQSLFASEYLLFINTFAQITVPTIWDTVSQLVFLVVGTISLSFAAIRGVKIRGVLNGGTLGILVSVPVMRFIMNILFTTWAGCIMSGPKTKDFPDGSPAGPACDPNGVPYLVSFHLCKGFEWIIIFIFAKIGQAQIWVNLSAAMAGSSMLMNGLIDLIKLIFGFVDPALIPQTLIIFNSVQTFVAYGLAAIGAFIQYNILETKKKPGGEGKTETKMRKYGEAKRFNAFLKRPISDMLWILSKLDALIMKAMEGKMKLAPGNSLNPAAMGEALKEMGGAMAEGVAIKAAIKASQPIMDPILSKVGLKFADVEGILNREITELEDAEKVASDPQGFLEKIWTENKPQLLNGMIDKAGEKFEPALVKVSLTWADVKDQVMQIIQGAASFAEIVEQLASPEALLNHPAIQEKIEAAKAAAEKVTDL